MKFKWLAPIPPYFAVWAGVFVFKSAWTALIGFHLGILLSLTLLRPALPVNMIFRPAKLGNVLLSLFPCAISGLVLCLVWNVFGIVNDLPARLASLGLTASTWAGFIAYFALVNPFFEEYFWRGVLGGESSGFHSGDLVYAGYHIMIVWDKAHLLSVAFVLFILTLVGWFWRQLYRRDKSLLAPVLGHMTADLSILLAVYFMNG